MAGQIQHLALNDTMGCAFVGVLFAVILYGCSCAQTMYYYREYPSDKIFLRIMVFSLWTFDSARTGLDVGFLWYWLITHHADPSKLSNLPTTFMAEFFLAALTVFAVQSYFIHTIWRLLGGRWYQIPFVLLMSGLCLTAFVGGIVSVYRINLNTNAIVAVVDASVPAAIQTVVSFVTDALITCTLCWILWGQKTGFKRTETLIATLMVYAIHRGIFTGLIQLAHFATFISTLHEDKLYWMIWHVPGSKIYVNSLLAVLNVRHHLTEVRSAAIETHVSVDTYPLGTVEQSGSYHQTRSRGAGRATASHTRIMLTKEIVRDDNPPDNRSTGDVGSKTSPL